MKQNRTICLILSLLLLFSLLSACAGGDQTGGGSSPQPGTSVSTPGAPDGSEPDGSDGSVQPDESGDPAPAEVDLAAFYEGICERYELGSLSLAEGEILDGFYPSIQEIDTQQCLIYVTRISINNGEIGLVQVTDAADAEAVKDIFQERIDYMVGDGSTPGGAWYPGPTQLWKNSSRVVTNGSYVMMIVHENCDDIVDEFNALF